jgi:predicted CoA-substrate-specific enzyme activase
MTKVVIMDINEEICSRVIGPTGAEHRRLAYKVMEEALEKADLSLDGISYIIATGYGRPNAPFADQQITELTCHAKGVVSLFPNAKTVIDIGGEDSKSLKIRAGKLVDFVMNDKCAAGTGRFLEVLADALGIRLEDLANISAKSTQKVKISSTCTVFARQDVVSRLSEGIPLPDIVAGIYDAIASQVAGMARKLKIAPDIVLTGGVAKNRGVVNAMKENLGSEVLVPDEPLLTGAIGAALLGKEIVMKAQAEGEPIPRRERYLKEATFLY